MKKTVSAFTRVLGFRFQAIHAAVQGVTILADLRSWLFLFAGQEAASDFVAWQVVGGRSDHDASRVHVTRTIPLSRLCLTGILLLSAS